MRVPACIVGFGGVLALACATAASAQAWAPNAFDDDATSIATARLNSQTSYQATPDARFGPALDFASELTSANTSPLVAADRRDIWFEGEGRVERITLETAGRLRRADGSPLPVTLRDQAELEPEAYDLRYVRGFRPAVGRTASGLEVSLTPHAGIGVGSEGGSAEAGATLKIGSGLERMVPDGEEAFGERSRWYVYAAGSGRAVGYNFARTRDGDYARSGYSHDSGAFLGDASIGVAYRRGAVHSSIGLVYREIEQQGDLHGFEGLDDDVDEGLIAFQLSIRPN